MLKYIILNDFNNYAISNTGIVINVKTKKRLTPVVNKSGYLQVSICQNGLKKTFLIHRLVALYFLDNIDNLPVVNHKDGVKVNNHVTNLEWCTSSQNTLHAQALGLKTDNRPIKAINLDDNSSIVFYSIGEAASFFKTNRGSIHRVLNGKRFKHKNHIFQYI